MGCGSDDGNDSGAADAMVQAADAAIADAAPVDASIADASPPDAADPDASIFPQSLADTGLYSDVANEVLADGVVEYTPAYGLWSDGATKKRWVLLPTGTTIDTTDMDFWVLPVGTKLWKEFTFEGTRVETRYMWKMGPAGSDWYYVTFAWNAAQNEALPVPAGVVDALGTTFDIPRENDCRKCHQRQPDFAIGFSAVQLATSNAGVTLDTLIIDNRLTVNPVGTSPYFPIPGTGDEQAVLGYLHANCGGCHHKNSDVMDTTNLNLRMEVATMATPEETTAYSTIVGIDPLLSVTGTTKLIAPQDIAASAIYQRMNIRGNPIQMPPRGTAVVDSDFLLVLEAWINSLPLP